MALKDDAHDWTVKEQIIEDPVSGLTIQFEFIPDDPDSPYRLRIFGDLANGNRELLFGRDGARTGAGVALAGSCKPTWLTKIDD